MSLPTKMQAVVIDNGKVVIKTVPLPQLDDEYILIQTKAVAGNPTDWKHVRYAFGPNGSIVGVDVAGEIVKLGSKVDTNKYHLGDYVYGFVHGSCHRRPDNGAFADYVALDSKVTFTIKKGLCHKDNIPEGPVDCLEAGASIPCSWLTAGATLFYHMGLEMVWEPKKVQRKETVLIWGGATALAQAILQLFKYCNAFENVIVVASKKHEQKLKEYGVSEVFDYHDVDVIDQIKSKFKDIAWLLDCVSTPETFNQLYQCAPIDHKCTIFNYTGLNIDTIKPELRHGNVTFDDTMIYSCFGYECKLGQDWVFPANQKYRDIVVKFVEFINDKLNNGPLQHMPIKVYKDGLKSTIQIMDDIENGRNSGEKLVAIFN